MQGLHLIDLALRKQKITIRKLFVIGVVGSLVPRHRSKSIQLAVAVVVSDL